MISLKRLLKEHKTLTEVGGVMEGKFKLFFIEEILDMNGKKNAWHDDGEWKAVLITDTNFNKEELGRGDMYEVDVDSLREMFNKARDYDDVEWGEYFEEMKGFANDDNIINLVGEYIESKTRAKFYPTKDWKKFENKVARTTVTEDSTSLADLEELGYDAGVDTYETISKSIKFKNRPDFKAFKKGFFQGFIDEASSQGLRESSSTKKIFKEDNTLTTYNFHLKDKTTVSYNARSYQKALDIFLKNYQSDRDIVNISVTKYK